MTRWLWVAPIIGGCWKVDRAVIPAGEVDFAPEVGAVDGWTIQQLTLDLECPDGLDARVVLVHPAVPDGPLPTALIFHSGSFDYVFDPSPGSPTDGRHLADPPRLDAAWSVRQAFATLGMYPAQVQGERHRDALPAALADAGIAMVLPVNCWGDWWHNEPGASDNDFEADLFARSGRVAAEWSFRALQDPAFAEAVGITWTFEPDPDALYALGLGEGGRAVGELLHFDDDEDGTPDYLPRAVMVDSLVDDLSDLAQAQPNTEEGLARVFPSGDFFRGAMYAAPVLPPTAWVYSPVDTALPAGSQDLALARLADGSEHVVIEGTAALHVLSNDDEDIAAQVVSFLLNAD
jgi:hypothetical protein